jgi:cysteine desulfurase
MTGRRTYLDWNASAPLRDEARAAMADAIHVCGNASSVHAEGRRARGLIESAREKVATLLGVEPGAVVFTSGGTEANVTALAPENAGATDDTGVCLVSAVEHPSVLAGGRFPAGALRKIRVTGDGRLDLDDLEAQLRETRASRTGAGIIVSVMAANNETGAVQPVAEAADIARRHEALLHVDAVQAAGRLRLDFERLGADMLSLSAHKIGGPQGAGALVLGSRVQLKPLLTGGGQEMRRRAGTENVAAIAGFGVAAELARQELPAMARVARLRDALERAIEGVAPESVIFAKRAERLANTTCFAVPGMKAETTVIGLDLGGVAVSAGSACSSGAVEPSHVLAAMGVEDALAGAALRVSLGAASDEADIERFLAVWSGLYERSSARRSAA